MTTAAFATYMENKIIDHFLRNTDYTNGATYLACFTSAGSEAELEAGTLTNEVSTAGTAYARVQIDTNLDAPSNGVTANTGEVAFAQATASWGTVTYIAIMDGDTEGAGNVLMFCTLDTAKAVDSGDTLKFAAGAIDITVT